jgi:hypothetical protein
LELPNKECRGFTPAEKRDPARLGGCSFCATSQISNNGLEVKKAEDLLALSGGIAGSVVRVAALLADGWKKKRKVVLVEKS